MTPAQQAAALVDAEVRGYNRRVSELVSNSLSAAAKKAVRRQAFLEAAAIALTTNTGGWPQPPAEAMRQAIVNMLQLEAGAK